MRYSELDKNERLALAGLISAMVRLDGSYTRDESDRLNAIADELGSPEAFWDAMEEASQSIDGPEKLREVAGSVKRRETRILILEVLEGLAAADGMSTSEDKMMDELAELWADDETGPYR